MSPEDFTAISELLKRRSGLILPPDKAYLLETRLRPVIRKHALAGLSAVAAALLRQDARITADVIDAMTTNETLFFRDLWPFTAFREVVLPALLAGRAAQRSFRILCAAASTGQEPYSLAMILAEEAARLRGWSCEIIAFDISPTALERARAGLYTQFEVQRGVPAAQLLKHFRRVNADWQIASELRAMVRFREFNLLDDLAPFGRCDVVFCRNVLIYFDPATKARTLANIGRRLPPDGYLFLGASETVMGLSSGFVPAAGCSGVSQPLATPAQATSPTPKRHAPAEAVAAEAVAWTAPAFVPRDAMPKPAEMRRRFSTSARRAATSSDNAAGVALPHPASPAARRRVPGPPSAPSARGANADEQEHEDPDRR